MAKQHLIKFRTKKRKVILNFNIHGEYRVKAKDEKESSESVKIYIANV